MRALLFILLTGALFLMWSCGATTIKVNNTIEVYEEYADLHAWIKANSDKILVINFWATSCPPCLKEMPHFKELESEFASGNVKVLLVSLDKHDDLDSRVYPFVKKHNITPEVALLADLNYSAWTDEIDESWYGALPATVIMNGTRKSFRFGAYDSYKELKEDVLDLLPNG